MIINRSRLKKSHVLSVKTDEGHIKSNYTGKTRVSEHNKI